MQPGSAPPAGWTPLTVAGIKNRKQYTLVSDGNVTVLRDEAPPVKAIAIATDTDNTGADATAYFGDIIFYKQILTNISPGKSAAP